MFRFLLCLLITTFLLSTPLSKAADLGCPLAEASPGQFGPFDYYDPDSQGYKLNIVESHHFTTQVEQLRQGQEGYVGADLDYTLRAFPNHPRALNAIAKLALQDKTTRPRGARFSTDCYFERAFAFSPQDATAHMVYGNYLNHLNKNNEALQQYQLAESLDPKNSNNLYNLGLIYLEMKQYDKAREYAKKASDLGFPLRGLQQRLKQVGQ